MSFHQIPRPDEFLQLTNIAFMPLIVNKNIRAVAVPPGQDDSV